MARADDRPPPTAPSRRPAGRIAMLITGFLIGAVLVTVVGVVLLGMRLVSVGAAEEVIEAPTPTATSTPTSTPTQPAATQAEGEVPEPCVRSAEYNITIDESLDQLAAGARDEDAKTLQEALDTIQGARIEAEGAAQACLALSGLSGTP